MFEVSEILIDLELYLMLSTLYYKREKILLR